MSDPDTILADVHERMDKAVTHLKDELRGIRTGRATPALVDHLRVDYYGTATPLSQLSQISIPEPRQIAVKPFDANALPEIEKAILKSELGLQPNRDGKLIRITLPPLSEDQRKKLAARAKDVAEETKVSLRNVRRDGNKAAEQAQKSHDISEDQARDLTAEVQEQLKKHEGLVEEILKSKTEEIMTV